MNDDPVRIRCQDRRYVAYVGWHRPRLPELREQGFLDNIRALASQVARTPSAEGGEALAEWVFSLLAALDDDGYHYQMLDGDDEDAEVISEGGGYGTAKELRQATRGIFDWSREERLYDTLRALPDVDPPSVREQYQAWLAAQAS